MNINMDKYYVFGLILLVILLCYGIFRFYVYSTSSYDETGSRTIFKDKIVEGRVYKKTDLYSISLNNKFTVGFLISPITPEYKFNELKHILSITRSNFTLPEDISPGTYIRRNGMEKIIKDDIVSLNEKQQTCKNLLTVKNTSKNDILLSAYITENAKSLAVNVNTRDGFETLYNYDIKYGEPQVVIIEVDKLSFNIYINGKLTNSKDMMSHIDFRTNISYSIVNGICGGFSGYIHNITCWPKLLTQKDKLSYSKYVLGTYKDITKNDINNSYPMVKCSI
jgi:hypothetical protein